MEQFAQWWAARQLQWNISFALFAATIIGATVIAGMRYKKKRMITPNKILFIGTFLSSVVFFIPIYFGKELTVWSSVVGSVQHAFRLFAMDGDFFEWVAEYEYYPEKIKNFYIGFGAVLYTFSPALTFGFILSFFKNLSAHLKYSCLFWVREVHVFSELNQKSLALATDISNRRKRFLGFISTVHIVFTDIIDKKEEISLELIDDAREIGAILFRKDLEAVCFTRKNLSRKLNFYLISEDEPEKIRHAESIIKNYDLKNVELRVFSDDIRTELLLAARVTENMTVERVNDIQAMIYHNLYVNGYNLFQRARKAQNGESVISVVIVGMGKYGTEMLKALTWFCQLDGYKLKINAFDTDEKAKEKFCDLCPELMSDRYNKIHTDGEPYYEIDIHSGIDVSVPEFEEKLKEINDATYFFVCLGNDETNLEISKKIREICERISYIDDGRKPDIETVIYDTTIRNCMGITLQDIHDCEQSLKNGKKCVRGITNYKSQPYNILMTGDLEHFYSEETVINSRLIKEGIEVNRSYSIDYEKFVFAEKRMADEWGSFISESGLTNAWEEYIAEWKNKKGITSEKYSFYEAKGGFDFMTSEESRKAKNADKDKMKELKNTATDRVEKWEKAVYAKFDELMKDKNLYDEWKKTESAATEAADKSFRFEYNYRSSIAKAIHKKLKSDIGFMPDLMNKPWKELTLEEKVQRGSVEHIRWNAYMRTEGYSYAAKRNDLAKVHHNLVPVSELTNDDLRKDA